MIAGNTPANITYRQPYGPTNAYNCPPIRLPKPPPVIITPSTFARCTSANASATSGIPSTTSAPVPTPVKNRQIPNVSGLWVSPCSAVHTATSTTLSISVRTRPK